MFFQLSVWWKFLYVVLSGAPCKYGSNDINKCQLDQWNKSYSVVAHVPSQREVLHAHSFEDFTLSSRVIQHVLCIIRKAFQFQMWWYSLCACLKFATEDMGWCLKNCKLAVPRLSTGWQSIFSISPHSTGRHIMRLVLLESPV